MLNNWSEASDADILAALAADPLWGELRAGRVHVLPYDARTTSVWGVTNYLDLVMPRL